MSLDFDKFKSRNGAYKFYYSVVLFDKLYQYLVSYPNKETFNLPEFCEKKSLS